MFRTVTAVGTLVALLTVVPEIRAGQAMPASFAGPPAPVAPETVARDAMGRTTIRAVRVETPLKIDGSLDESLYRHSKPVIGFTQVEPRSGQPATERTELWIAFDDVNVYYAVRLWYSQMDKLVATEMRRDNSAISAANDFVSVAFDTFYDRRNGYAFNVNALAGRADGQIANSRAFNSDVNLIWEVKSGRFDGGWTLEAAIPFKSLRYKPGRNQVWGFNALRSIPAKNEISYVTPMPQARGLSGILQMAQAATLVGIEAPPPSRNLEIKPYATSHLTTDRTIRPPLANDLGGDLGGDLKYTLTQGLTLDARGDDTSYRAQLDYTTDRYGLQLERLAIGDNFAPDVGFARRDNMLKHYGQVRFSPRLSAGRALTRRVRKFDVTGTVNHIESGTGRLETRERSAAFAVDFQNADVVSITVGDNYEFLPAPFAIAPGVRLPVGGYHFAGVDIAYNMAVRRRRGASFLLERGTFYNGNRTALTASRGRIQVGNQLAIEPSYSINRVHLVQGSFTTHLGGSRVTYTVTPLMFASALIQYNSGSNNVSLNARLRWEYRPGSELFVVYNEQRDTRVPSFPGLANRAHILKINRLVRF